MPQPTFTPEQLEMIQRLTDPESTAARVCGICGRAISTAAGYVERSPLGHTHAPGTCEVCGRSGSTSPSIDFIGLGD